MVVLDTEGQIENLRRRPCHLDRVRGPEATDGDQVCGRCGEQSGIDREQVLVAAPADVDPVEISDFVDLGLVAPLDLELAG